MQNSLRNGETQNLYVLAPDQPSAHKSRRLKEFMRRRGLPVHSILLPITVQ